MPRQTLVGLCLAFFVVTAGCRAEESRYEGFSFSPDGTSILAVYFSHGSSFIYKVNVNNGKAGRFTAATDGFEGVPSFSPDGKRVAYSYSPRQGGNSRIVIANADGSDPKTLANSGTNDFRPVLSADNKTIVFARYGFYGNYSPIARPAQHEWNFYASDIDGASVRQLTKEDFYMVSRAAVSPDGRNLLFVSSEEHGDVMMIYSLEQPPKPRLTIVPRVPDDSGEATLNDPNYLPDGKSIVFLAASGKGAFSYDIYQMDLASRKIEKLTEKNGYCYGLHLSRDGKTAVFLKDSSSLFGKKTEVFLFDFAARKTTLLNISGID